MSNADEIKNKSKRSDFRFTIDNLRMQYHHNKEEASEYLRIALPLLKKHGSPADPLHYTVWYTYASGQNKMLTNEIDQLLADGKEISSEVCADLHRKYIQMYALETLDLYDSTDRVITTLNEEISSSGRKVKHYGEVLDSVEDEIQTDIHPDILQKIVEKLSTETSFIQAVNNSLRENLEASTGELTALRNELSDVRRMANTDVLTGIPNRQAFDLKIKSLLDEDVSNFCLMVLDIDHFKQFNDNFGHQLGDKVLRFVAQSLKKHLKGQDFIARFGGEEFIILLPDTPFQGAMVVAEKLRETIQKQRLRRTDNQEDIGNITLSIGVSSFRSGENIEDLIERADKALYQSKKSGRNRVTAEAELIESI